MLFNSFEFLFLFLPITYAVFWRLRSAAARYIWLAVTGYIFYGYWNPWFCLLMLFSTLVSFTAGLGFLHYFTPGARRICLVVPITVDLLLLGFFKYAFFATNTAHDLVSLCGYNFAVPHWMKDIILPVGISFYTFHTITYIVDSYRGAIKPTRNFFEFAAYVSLFSQLVAGPIVRFRQLEEDLEGLGHADRTRWLAIGISYFSVGMIEKVLVADSLAGFANQALEHYQHLSSFGVWLAVLGYTFQLYFDFCGYSSMAIGLGYLFGLRIPINFNSPYKALDPSDFWQRWHISLSSCLRDYLYIPLGGSRGGTWLTYRNLLLTMLIGGLWHGANWTFVVWGAYHGALLVLYRLCGARWDRLPPLMRQVGFFLLVVIGWVLFRADNMEMASRLLHAMFVPTEGYAGVPVAKVLGLLFVAGWWAMRGPNAIDLHRDFTCQPRYYVYHAIAFGACMAMLAGGKNSPFLYFQF
jgi:alginate O-acetyltransferase complex protein AlgI